MQPDPNTGAGALTQMAYGDAGAPLSMDSVPQFMNQAVPPQEMDRISRMGFWGGLASPEGNPGGSPGYALGNAIRGQQGAEMEEQKLRAQYVPLIMQSIIAQQTMAMNASKNVRDYINQSVPKFNSHMGTMAPSFTQGKVPTYDEAVNHALDFINANQTPTYLSRGMLSQIPQDDAQRGTWLNRLAMQSAGLDKMVPSLTKTAKDQNVVFSPGTNTISAPQVPGAGPGAAPGATPGPGMPGADPTQAAGAPAADATQGGSGAPNAGAGGAGAPGAQQPVDLNPTKADAEMATAGKEALQKHGEDLMNETQINHDVVSRMVETNQLLNDLQTGKYTLPVTGMAASVKYAAMHFGMKESQANDLANKMVGAAPGSKNALAASQAISQFALMESMAQMRDAVSTGRYNRNEFVAFQNKVNALGQDPEAFRTMYDFMRQRYGNQVNRLSGYAGYATKAGMTVNPYQADADYHQAEAQRMLSGSGINEVGAGPVAQPAPTSALNTQPSRIAAAQANRAATQAAAQAATQPAPTQTAPAPAQSTQAAAPASAPAPVTPTVAAITPAMQQKLADLQKRFPNAVLTKSGRYAVPDKSSSTGYRALKVQ